MVLLQNPVANIDHVKNNNMNLPLIFQFSALSPCYYSFHDLRNTAPPVGMNKCLTFKRFMYVRKYYYIRKHLILIFDIYSVVLLCLPN